jgi:hypothetical protein
MIEPSHMDVNGEVVALMQVSIDPVFVEVLLVGTIGAIAALVGAIAVLRAVQDARSSPTKAEQGLVPVLAERLAMIVAAQDRMSDPLHLHFTLTGPAVTLLRIELANQLDKATRTAQCVKEAPGIFVTSVEPKVVQRWYNANPYWDGETKKLPIRVFFITHGQAACRTIWVKMSPRTMPDSGLADVSDFEWFLQGPCSRVLPTLGFTRR